MISTFQLYNKIPLDANFIFYWFINSHLKGTPFRHNIISKSSSERISREMNGRAEIRYMVLQFPPNCITT